ncbi:unnamed protein product [Moneuplotes crassus]|uniref:Uncharacterized protein n=1 Tax=Euplotes crassus TaxID=5936 RepID=A0AAD1Y6I1_EUPCR|nr:unnamed protein product [Moneuplotes crassus]
MEKTSPLVNLLDKISNCSNILPYYGYLDQCRNLAKNLCKSTREMWEENIPGFSGNLLKNQIRKIVIKNSFKKIHADMLLRNDNYTVFKLDLNLDTVSSLDAFIYFYKSLRFPELVKIDKIKVKPGDDKVVLENIYEILLYSDIELREENIQTYAKFNSNQKYQVPFMHEAYFNLALNTERAYSLSVRPPEDILLRTTLYAKKLNVHIDSQTPDELELEINDQLKESVNHLRVIFKDEVPIKTPTNTISQLKDLLGNITLLELEYNIYIDAHACYHIDSVNKKWSPDIIKFNSIGGSVIGKAVLKEMNKKVPTIFYATEANKKLSAIQAETISFSWTDIDDFKIIPQHEFTVFYSLNSINFKNILKETQDNEWFTEVEKYRKQGKVSIEHECCFFIIPNEFISEFNMQGVTPPLCCQEEFKVNIKTIKHLEYLLYDDEINTEIWNSSCYFNVSLSGELRKHFTNEYCEEYFTSIQKINKLFTKLFERKLTSLEIAFPLDSESIEYIALILPTDSLGCRYLSHFYAKIEKPDYLKSLLDSIRDSSIETGALQCQFKLQDMVPPLDSSEWYNTFITEKPFFKIEFFPFFGDIVEFSNNIKVIA